MSDSSSPVRVLLSNDDGVDAPGLFVLYQALVRAGHRVTVCAPHRPRSASGHAITMHKPLRLHKTKLRDGSDAWAGSGTPADCVILGLEVVVENAVDVVIAGINHGPNLGWDVSYSGTVSAALEGAVSGFPAIAVSVAAYADEMHYEPVAEFVAQTLTPLVAAHGLPTATLLNVNAPNIPANEVKGIKVTTQGHRQYVDRIEKRLDPTGRPYYWLGGRIHDRESSPESDTRAVGDGYFSVTPIHLDLTAYPLLPSLRDWPLEA